MRKKRHKYTPDLDNSLRLSVDCLPQIQIQVGQEHVLSNPQCDSTESVRTLPPDGSVQTTKEATYSFSIATALGKFMSQQ